MKKALIFAAFALIIATAFHTARAASPVATVNYVNNVATNVLEAAKAYTNQHTPEIDLTPYEKKVDADKMTDTATNVVWQVVASNGWIFVKAYTNTVNTAAQ